MTITKTKRMYQELMELQGRNRVPHRVLDLRVSAPSTIQVTADIRCEPSTPAVPPPAAAMVCQESEDGELRGDKILERHVCDTETAHTEARMQRMTRVSNLDDADFKLEGIEAP